MTSPGEFRHIQFEPFTNCRGDHFDIPGHFSLRSDSDDPAGSDGFAIPWHLLDSAAQSKAHATGFTHALYRYPARMSPDLARAIILGLTKTGDLILDPFVGGGTVAIEALSNGRRIICSDLNSLACFITRAKAWPANSRSITAYQDWAVSAVGFLATHPNAHVPLLTKGGMKYAPKTHGLLQELAATARAVKDFGARRLAVLTVLRIGQICFDCRRLAPNPFMLTDRLSQISSLLIKQMTAYSASCRQFDWTYGLQQSCRVYQSDALALVNRLTKTSSNQVSLILTSPPYPGVHVLYHRWQVYSRKETDLPYQLANLNDGAFESHYTLGSRRMHDPLYYERLTNIFSSLRCLTSESTLIAQVVGFSQSDLQLPLYRAAMHAAGYEEVNRPDSPENVITRVVPHRRWYAERRLSTCSEQEYLLLHRPLSAAFDKPMTSGVAAKKTYCGGSGYDQ